MTESTTLVVLHLAPTAQLGTLVKTRVVSQDSVTLELVQLAERWNVLAQLMGLKSYLFSRALQLHATLVNTASREASQTLTCANPVLVDTVAHRQMHFQQCALLENMKALKVTPMDVLPAKMTPCALPLMPSHTHALMDTILPMRPTIKETL
jgi:hypothetical protein